MGSPFVDYAHKRAEDMTATPQQLIWLSHQHSMIYDEYSVIIDETRLRTMNSIDSPPGNLLGRFTINIDNIILVEISRNGGKSWFHPSIYLRSKWPLVKDMNRLKDMRSCVIRNVPHFTKLVNKQLIKFGIYKISRIRRIFQRFRCKSTVMPLVPITIDLPIIILAPDSMRNITRTEPDAYNVTELSLAQLQKICKMYGCRYLDHREYMEGFILTHVNS